MHWCAGIINLSVTSFDTVVYQNLAQDVVVPVTLSFMVDSSVRQRKTV